jgi:hypothetical protein
MSCNLELSLLSVQDYRELLRNQDFLPRRRISHEAGYRSVTEVAGAAAAVMLNTERRTAGLIQSIMQSCLFLDRWETS